MVQPAASLWEPGVSHEGYIRCAETVLLRGGLCDRTLNLGAIYVAEAAPEGHDRIAHCALVPRWRLGEPGVVRNHQQQVELRCCTSLAQAAPEAAQVPRTQG